MRKGISAALLTTLALFSACKRRPSDGQTLAHKYCGACHAFPDPSLLDKKSWVNGVLPQMSRRVGLPGKSLFDETSQSPYLTTLPDKMSEADWQKIVDYFRNAAPDSLPDQSLPTAPTVDPAFFRARPFASGLPSSGIITLIKVDTTRRRVFVGDAGRKVLEIFDFNGRLTASISLSSPATDLLFNGNELLVLEVGILDPNDEAKGQLVRYDFVSSDSLKFGAVVLDSLLRPVFVRRLADNVASSSFIVCEYGNNRGRLAIYTPAAGGHRRDVLDASPGAVLFEQHDLTGDGNPDLVVLFAQGDERIALFENDGKGGFKRNERVLLRFPPVYGSMDFSLHDFNGDGKPDIVYVNGDNFDYSRVLKPYHGVRIFENDGNATFREKFFFPVYGAAGAQVNDFNGDGRLDILVTSNFADFARHPERGIVFLANDGGYKFDPYSFSSAAANQWNRTAAADLNNDGYTDVIIGAMDLGNIARIQRRGYATQAASPLLLLSYKSEHSPVTQR